MTDNPITCQEFVELVTDYLEGALSEEERARFEEHLSLCPGCQTYIVQVQQTVDALGDLTEDSVPPETRDQALSVFRNWKRRTE